MKFTITRDDAREAANHQGPALCVDCGTDTEPRVDGVAVFEHWDMFLVRRSVWEAAGMDGEWRSGFLCTSCIERRLGRRLRSRDYLAKRVEATATTYTTEMASEYLQWYEGGFVGPVP